MKNCPHVSAPYAFSPSSLTICASALKKNDVCGLISSSALPAAVFDGAIAAPFDPRGSPSAFAPSALRRDKSAVAPSALRRDKSGGATEATDDVGVLP